MSFKKDLRESEFAVDKTLKLLEKMKLTDIKRVGEGMTGHERRDEERRFGDLSAIQGGKKLCIEVKSFAKMGKIGRVFLETWSDNGSVTGNKTKGWMSYDDTECDVDIYIFYSADNPKKSVSVKRSELRAMIQKIGGAYTPTEMKSNMKQKNRSEGLVVPLHDIEYHCKSFTWRDLS